MQDNGKTLIFVNTREFSPIVARKIDEAVKSARGGSAQVVYFNSKAPLVNGEKNIDMKLSEDYLKREDHEAIDAYVINLSRTWYLAGSAGGTGTTRSGGVDLGGMVEFDFHDFLSFRIKNLAIIRKIVEIEDPGRIVAIEDTGELIGPALAVAAWRGIEVTAINLKPLSERVRDVLSRLRDRLSDIFYFRVLDPLVRIFLSGKLPEGSVMIDPRAMTLLTGSYNMERITFFCIEKGMSNRLDALRKGGMYVSFDVPLAGKAAREIEEKAADLRKSWVRLGADPLFRSRFVYEGIDIWRMVEKKVREFFGQRFLKILRIMRQVEDMAKRNKIKVMVFRADGREKEKAIITAAGNMNIPTIYVTHGVLAENNGHDILHCTKTAVWGQADFDRYVSLGNPSSKLAITGSPKYDRLVNKEPYLGVNEVYEKVGLERGKDYVILATQPVRKFSSFNTYEEMELITECVLRAMGRMPEMQLVIKLHPFDEFGAYERILKQARMPNVFLIRDIDNLSLIKSSALLLAFNSTAAFEAMMLDKPVIIINLGKRGDAMPYVSRGGALGVYNANDLAAVMKKALTDPSVKERLRQGRRDVVSYYLYKQDGRASERVAELINNAGAS